MTEYLKNGVPREYELGRAGRSAQVPLSGGVTAAQNERGKRGSVAAPYVALPCGASGCCQGHWKRNWLSGCWAQRCQRRLG